MADCGCVYTAFDGDGPSVSSEEIRRARKPRPCCECAETIQRGERYEYSSGCWDGRWDSHHTCLACVEIRELLFCEGFNYTALWDDVREYFNEGGNPMGCIHKLESAAAKEKLSAEYRNFLKLAE